MYNNYPGESAVMRQLQEDAAQGAVKLNFFSFDRTFLAAAPGAVPPQNFQISNNIDFLICYINGTVTNPIGTNIAIPDITIQLADNSTGWLFSDQAMHWNNVVGTAQRPFILPEPKLVPSNASIDIQLNNLTAATTFARIDIGIFGAQVFELEPGYLRDRSPLYFPAG